MLYVATNQELLLASVRTKCVQEPESSTLHRPTAQFVGFIGNAPHTEIGWDLIREQFDAKIGALYRAM